MGSCSTRSFVLMRILPTTGLFLAASISLLLPACTPKAVRPLLPTAVASPTLLMEAAVKVPARHGIEVGVRIEDLIETDTGFRKAFGVKVRFCGALVPSAVVGGEPGTRAGRWSRKAEVRFQVRHSNRHSPYLVYTLTADHVAPAKKKRQASAESNAAVFRPVPFLQPAILTETVSSQRRLDWMHAAEIPSNTDYLIIAPRALLEAARPLLLHRRRTGHKAAMVAAETIFALYSGGNPYPETLARAVFDVSRYTRGRLSYLLLVGDCEVQYRPSVDSAAFVPTFYLPKMVYRAMAYTELYPTDHPYASAGAADRAGHAASRLRVGRIPARTAAELDGYVQKLVRYETRDRPGPWQRRLYVVAGPANFSPLVDTLIESLARSIFETQVPDHFDLGILFAKEDSPYAYRPDRLPQKMVADLNRGALIAVYVGHEYKGGFDYMTFRGRHYRIGTMEDMSRLRIGTGKPFFLLISCSHGAFDLSGGRRSMAELLLLHRQGPVAVLASSRESHPYPNYLLGAAFVDRLLKRRPFTVGEGVQALKRRMLESGMPVARFLLRRAHDRIKTEHAGLYNLFGDPALRLRYPRVAPLSLDGKKQMRKAAFSPQSPVTLTARLDQVPAEVELAIENVRGQMLSPLSPISSSLPFFRQLALMENNYEKISRRVLHRVRLKGKSQLLRHTFKAPSRPGRYVITLFAAKGLHAVTGAVRFTVGSIR